MSGQNSGYRVPMEVAGGMCNGSYTITLQRVDVRVCVYMPMTTPSTVDPLSTLLNLKISPGFLRHGWVGDKLPVPADQLLARSFSAFLFPHGLTLTDVFGAKFVNTTPTLYMTLF